MKLSSDSDENQAEGQKKPKGAISSSWFLIVFHGRVAIREFREYIFTDVYKAYALLA